MNTKTQRRQIKRYKEEQKSAVDRLQNLDSNGIAQLENYIVYQILYLNDTACNACKFLGDELKTIPYKSKAVQTIYNALMKRVNAYWEYINIAEIDKYALAELFGEMDEYLDEPVANFKKTISDFLAENGIEHAHWVASVECAYTMCEYAVVCAKDYLSSLCKVSPNGKYILGLVIEEIRKVAREMSHMVQTIHVGKTTVDLNQDTHIKSAFKKLNKAYTNPTNFLDAVNTADKENEANNRQKLM